MIKLKQLLKEETFTATNKQSGKTSVFKSKDSRDAAIKAGTHDAMKDKGQPKSEPKVAGSDMFGGDYAKDRGGKAASKSNTNWMDDLDSIDVSDIKGKADPSADSWTHNDVFGATFKDPQTGKPISVGDAYEREDNSPAYQKAFAYVSQFDPDGEAIMGTQAYSNLQNKTNNSGDWMDDLDSIDVSDIKGKADPNADSFTNNDVFGATFKDPKTGKTITVGDAYAREDDSPAYQKAFAYVSQFDPDKEAVVGTQAYSNLQKNEGMIKLSKLMENDPCWKGYKQVGMKDKNGREVPNCVPEGVVKEAGIPKLFLKIEAVKKKIKALEAERKSKYGGEYARKLNAETDVKKKHELAQPILAITKEIAAQQKNLFNMLDMEERYYANMGKDDELDPNF
jgi:hypothetical protein